MNADSPSTTPEPTERDHARARELWRAARYADPADAPEVEEVIAAARAEGRAEGVHEGRDDVLTVLERMLANPADAARVMALLEASA